MNNFLTNFSNIQQDIDIVVLSMRWSRHLTPSDFDNTIGGIETLGQTIEIYDLNDANQKPLSTSDIQKSIRETIRFFQDQDIDVIVIYPIPEMGWHVPKHLIRQIRNGEKTDGSIPRHVFQGYNQIGFETINAIENIKRVYPHEILCDENRCHAITDNGIPLYFDDDHPSPYAAELIANDIYERIIE